MASLTRPTPNDEWNRFWHRLLAMVRQELGPAAERLSQEELTHLTMSAAGCRFDELKRADRYRRAMVWRVAKERARHWRQLAREA